MNIKEDLYINWLDYGIIIFAGVGCMCALYNLPIQYFMSL